jgi:hypothetical protein
MVDEGLDSIHIRYPNFKGQHQNVGSIKFFPNRIGNAQLHMEQNYLLPISLALERQIKN